MKQTELKGIITPILTPMNADESINTDELRTQIDRLIDGGVHGIFPFGTNGEGYILNEKEKCEVLERRTYLAGGRKGIPGKLSFRIVWIYLSGVI